MKNEKYTPMSKRQRRKLESLGVTPDPRWTQYEATRAINVVLQPPRHAVHGPSEAMRHEINNLGI